MIGVIDYQTGNSMSVSYALRHLGVEHRVVSSPRECADIDRYVLPGVGSAEVTMESLRTEGWVDHLESRVLGDRLPFLGICVGLQVLFEHSEEGDVACLGWLPGEVRAFRPDQGRVPHMGWNNVTRRERTHPFADALVDEGYFYFVNSYFAAPTNARDIVGSTDYQGEFASIVARDNIVATQFHVEKSGKLGLALLRKFADLGQEQFVAQ